MSSEHHHRRRCIIQKLDFENCIVTNGKTKARGRKKLRARITRRIEDVPDDVPSDASSAAAQTSPVLIARPPGDRKSSALLKRKKLGFSEEEQEDAEETTLEDPCSPSSPVFKLFKRNKTLNESRSWCGEPFEGAEGQNCTLDSSYQIDDATTQESNESIKISSVESTDAKNRSICSSDSTAEARRNSPGQFMTSSFRVPENFDSPKTASKKSYKKNSLLGRLQKLQQKQASEKLLWQHQNRNNSGSGLRLTVLTFWKNDVSFFLKCKTSSSDLPVTFLAADSRWVPKLRKVKRASILQLHPPWQRLTVEGCGATILVNVICLDVLEEEEELVGEERMSEAVAAEEFETQEKLFVDSLFCCSGCGFLC